MNNSLPVGWEWVPLSKITDGVETVVPEQKPKEFFDYIDIASVDNEKNKILSPKKILGSEAPSRARQLVKSGDTIFSTVRTYLKNIAFVDEQFNAHVASTGFAVLRPKKNVEAKFIFYRTISDEFLEPLNALQRGISYPAVRNSVVFEQPIPLPPLAEQKRIVAKLDAAFAHLETLKQGLERIPELLKKFRQTVLSHAVTGKLTEDWREENPIDTTDDLIKQVVEKRYERLSNSYKKNRSLKPENLKINLRKDLDLFSIPESWSWVNLDFLVDETDYFCYGVVQPEDEVESGNKLIRVKDLYNGKVEHAELRTISQEIDVVYKRSKVKEGDILISLVGTIGRTAIVSESESGYNIARALGKIPILDFNSKYVKLFLDSSVAQQWLHGDAREVARKTLNLEQLKSLPVALPPLEEQQEIVTRVEGLLAQAEALEARYRALKAHLDKLPGALLAKAFRGELVPQDPTEVPAPSAPQPLAVAPARRGPGQQQTLGF